MATLATAIAVSSIKCLKSPNGKSGFKVRINKSSTRRYSRSQPTGLTGSAFLCTFQTVIYMIKIFESHLVGETFSEIKLH
jgi:hypothetical protein